MTHLENIKKVTRRVGKNYGVVSIIKHGGGHQVKAVINRGPSKGNILTIGLTKAKRLYPTLNPKKLIRAAASGL